MLEKILSEGYAEMGLTPHEKSIERLRTYFEMLEERNKVMNLTAISGEEDCARLHFLDSSAALLCADMAGKSVIDVGTGAGFPGLPLKIMEPSIRLTLLDSLDKRIRFLGDVCAETGLENVEFVHGRAEEPGEMRESFDFAVSRAVARLSMLCEFCLPYVKLGGSFLALKGPAAQEELEEAKKAISILGGKVEKLFEYAVPGTELRHNIVIIRKVSPTPKKYPRRFAMMKKSPL
ncbi:MAG: 16S rRNA (guanine(527)-N(7))-methyltransferase RsmG [Oscillospiraceae bacterium]|nr:16S rRNA (guanine(527)-N(7))-methyltransferase RsmG [Oscillospiraceae bacterium]